LAFNAKAEFIAPARTQRLLRTSPPTIIRAALKFRALLQGVVMHVVRLFPAFALAASLLASIPVDLPAAEPAAAQPAALQKQAASKPKPKPKSKTSGFPIIDLKELISFGVDRAGEPLGGCVVPEFGYDDPRPRVLVVFRRTKVEPEKLTEAALADDPAVNWSFIGLYAGDPERAETKTGGDPTRGYPPQGGYYDHPTDPEARYVWRWIGMHAPDLVVEVDSGPGETWYAPESDLPQLKALVAALPGVKPLAPSDELVSQLVRTAPCDTGVIPALRVVTDSENYVARLEQAIKATNLPPSAARLEIRKRLARSPEQIADQLLQVYGKQLSSVAYIPALAIVGRLRHERNVGGETKPISPIALKAVEPYVSGAKPTHDPKKPNGSGTAGHLVFGELANLTGDKRYVELVKSVADLAFEADGSPRPAMPAHSEMSDAVFMGCPILAQAGKLTGDVKYFDACLRNFRFMEKLCLRKDGMYRHSPLDEAAWGRGNGFPALGLAWTLSEMPESYAGRQELVKAFQKHMQALKKHQDLTGCWHQVIDHDESYREFTSTAMITYSLMRGVQMSILDREEYDPLIQAGWEAIKARIAADGKLVDVCTGTGKQKSLRDYYDRPAILGNDDRGGAMALMVTTEMERYAK
jgi:rhamnogalacturonyl hydrolase YesR